MGGGLQAGQPNRSLEEDCGADPPDSHVQALTRQEGDWEQPGRINQRQIMSDLSDCLL